MILYMAVLKSYVCENDNILYVENRGFVGSRTVMIRNSVF
jgi:hypothetical protein